MTRSDFLANLAESSAALVQDYDLTGMLIHTISEAVAVADADAGGLLVVTDTGALELLSATSHAAVALETYQAFSGEGPCQECISQQESIALTQEEVAASWPTVGELMHSAGYHYVVAAPLRWRGSTLGGLNLFWADPVSDAETIRTEIQVFADVLTLFIVNSEPITPAVARKHVARALELRAVVEQAKGVLAEQENLAMPEAYLRLMELERESHLPLSAVARNIIGAAQERPGGGH